MNTYKIRFLNPANRREGTKEVLANSPREAARPYKNVVSVTLLLDDCRKEMVVDKKDWA